MNAEVPASDGEAEHHSSTTSSVSQQTTAQQTIFKQRAQKSKQTRQNRAQKLTMSCVSNFVSKLANVAKQMASRVAHSFP